MKKEDLFIICLLSLVLCLPGCEALSSILGQAQDPSTTAGAITAAASIPFPWLPVAVSILEAAVGGWLYFRGKKWKNTAITFGKAIESTNSADAKTAVNEGNSLITRFGRWIEGVIRKYIDPK